MWTFEGTLGRLQTFLCGTVGYLNQISNKFVLEISVRVVEKQVNFNNDDMSAFYEQLESGSGHGVSKSIDQVSPIRKQDLELEISKFFSDKFNIMQTEGFYSERCVVFSKMFHSLSYIRKQSCDNYTVKNGFGQIRNFIQVKNVIYAIINKI